MAEETWPFDAGSVMDTETLLRKILDVRDIEGITFLGGEPFEQPEALGFLAQRVRSAGLSVVVFTGYTYAELLSGCHAQNRVYVGRLLEAADLLIDGSFVQEQFDLSRPWVGSGNQQFYFLSERYNENDLLGIHNQIEIRIAQNGAVLINGMGEFSKIKNLL
jgi:anaerobic ribonucleoside-triphosphate reductase activating protein